MNAFKVLAFFALVAVAASVTIRGCGSDSKRSLNLDWDKCTQNPDKQSYNVLILVSGSLADKNATATLKGYYETGDTTCSGKYADVTGNCSCDYTGALFQLECGAAAGVIPSVLLIIAAIMAHLF
eukprot:TRINITY_DN5527_c0_g1_i5.p1 TRINITY_DN5527_c0_g1~~TRINITY_DN5527_c0_g1_i5.p1  ORF type:complete len:145 (+),score=51.03 TRINITY_DN5527_c0_g1_i5:61-435(+)